MTVNYEVQGRRAADGVRLATEQSMSAALTTAESMAADGFTAWVFETKQQARGKTYRLVRTLDPYNLKNGEAV